MPVSSRGPLAPGPPVQRCTSLSVSTVSDYNTDRDADCKTVLFPQGPTSQQAAAAASQRSASGSGSSRVSTQDLLSGAFRSHRQANERLHQQAYLEVPARSRSGRDLPSPTEPEATPTAAPVRAAAEYPHAVAAAEATPTPAAPTPAPTDVSSSTDAFAAQFEQQLQFEKEKSARIIEELQKKEREILALHPAAAAAAAAATKGAGAPVLAPPSPAVAPAPFGESIRTVRIAPSSVAVPPPPPPPQHQQQPLMPPQEHHHTLREQPEVVAVAAPPQTSAAATAAPKLRIGRPASAVSPPPPPAPAATQQPMPSFVQFQQQQQQQQRAQAPQHGYMPYASDPPPAPAAAPPASVQQPLQVQPLQAATAPAAVSTAAAVDQHIAPTTVDTTTQRERAVEVQRLKLEAEMRLWEEERDRQEQELRQKRAQLESEAAEKEKRVTIREPAMEHQSPPTRRFSPMEAQDKSSLLHEQIREMREANTAVLHDVSANLEKNKGCLDSLRDAAAPRPLSVSPRAAPAASVARREVSLLRGDASPPPGTRDTGAPLIGSIPPPDRTVVAATPPRRVPLPLAPPRAGSDSADAGGRRASRSRSQSRSRSDSAAAAALPQPQASWPEHARGQSPTYSQVHKGKRVTAGDVSVHRDPPPPPPRSASLEASQRRSSGGGSGRRMSRYEALYQHSLELHEKRRTLQEQQHAEEMQECTFKPHLNTATNTIAAAAARRRSSSRRGSAGSSGTQPSSPTGQRRRCREQHQPTEERRLREQLRECTFEPKIHRHARPSAPSTASGDCDEGSASIRGYEQAVRRVQDARGVRAAREEAAPAEWHNEPTVPTPFEFTLPKRKGERRGEPPLVFVDVTIGSNARVSGRIGIHEHDTPGTLVDSFATVYKLDAKQRMRLYRTIHSTMLEHVPSYRALCDATPADPEPIRTPPQPHMLIPLASP